MRRILRYILNLGASFKVRASSDTTIASTAKVNYAGIASRPPSVLRIGHGTIFEGKIASDRAGSEISIGENSYVGASLLVCASKIEIGSDVLISWGCTLIDHDSHAVPWAQRANDVKAWSRGEKDWSAVRIRPIKICDKAWLGFNVTVLSGVTVGEGAVVGSGSIVTKDVAPFTVVAGNPARPIRQIAHE